MIRLLRPTTFALILAAAGCAAPEGDDGSTGEDEIESVSQAVDNPLTLPSDDGKGCSVSGDHSDGGGKGKMEHGFCCVPRGPEPADCTCYLCNDFYGCTISQKEAVNLRGSFFEGAKIVDGNQRSVILGDVKKFP